MKLICEGLITNSIIKTKKNNRYKKMCLCIGHNSKNRKDIYLFIQEVNTKVNVTFKVSIFYA